MTSSLSCPTTSTKYQRENVLRGDLDLLRACACVISLVPMQWLFTSLGLLLVFGFVVSGELRKGSGSGAS